jgi:hypothetical protein
MGVVNNRPELSILRLMLVCNFIAWDPKGVLQWHFAEYQTRLQNKYLLFLPKKNFLRYLRFTSRDTEIETTMCDTCVKKVISKACFTLVSCLAYSSTLKMEATCSPGTSVDFQRTTRRHVISQKTELFTPTAVRISIPTFPSRVPSAS